MCCPVGAYARDSRHRFGDDAVVGQSRMQADIGRGINPLRDIARELGHLKQVGKSVPILPQAHQIALLDPMAEIATVETGANRPHLVDVETPYPMPLFAKLQIGHFDFIQETLQNYHFS